MEGLITAITTPDERVKNWKIFRKSLENLNELDALQQLATYWASVPFVDNYLDYECPNTWPTPWEILYNGTFCPTAIAFLMFKTLELSAKNWQKNQMKICIIKDLAKSEIISALVLNNTYVLNYEYSSIIFYSDINNDSVFICEHLGNTLP
jgi:hypothetical protein